MGGHSTLEKPKYEWYRISIKINYEVLEYNMNI